MNAPTASQCPFHVATSSTAIAAAVANDAWWPNRLNLSIPRSIPKR
jgi:catalase-peroxidase